jgi:hypothetical protein
LDQGRLARRMQNLGTAWRQVTVSEVERNRRNVTVPELVALTLALNVTIEQLLDPREPEGLRGPRLALSEGMTKVSEDDEAVDRRVLGPTIAPEDITALVCSHEAWADIEWDDQQQLTHIEWRTES